jgi:hypothetical protein
MTSVEIAKEITVALVNKLVLSPNIHEAKERSGLAEWVGQAYLVILKSVNAGYELK